MTSNNDQLEDAIDYLNNGESSNFKRIISSMLTQKANVAINMRKEIVAQTVFNSEED